MEKNPLNEPPLIRCFLGLPLAGAFIQEIKEYYEKLPLSVRGISWVRPENIHVTLHFFGELSAEQIRQVQSLVPNALQNQSALSFALSGVGCFPNAMKPRVVWLGLKGDLDPLMNLQKRIENRLSSAGFPIEEREFKPHATIARIKTFSPSVSHALSKLPSPPSTPMKSIPQIILFRSDLGNSGPQYTPLSVFCLL